MASDDASHEEILMATGKLVGNAALTEAIMCNALRVLVGCTPLIATQIFYTLDALPTRRQLLQRVSRAVENNALGEIVERISKAADKANRQRKAVAHALLYFKEEPGKTGSVFNPKTGATNRATRSYLTQLLRESGKGVEEVIAAYHDLCKARGVSSETFLENPPGDN